MPALVALVVGLGAGWAGGRIGGSGSGNDSEPVRNAALTTLAATTTLAASATTVATAPPTTSATPAARAGVEGATSHSCLTSLVVTGGVQLVNCYYSFDYSLPANAQTEIRAACPRGSLVIDGYYSVRYQAGQSRVVESGTGLYLWSWFVRLKNTSNAPVPVTVSALCIVKQ